MTRKIYETRSGIYSNTLDAGTQSKVFPSVTKVLFHTAALFPNCANYKHIMTNVPSLPWPDEQVNSVEIETGYFCSRSSFTVCGPLAHGVFIQIVFSLSSSSLLFLSLDHRPQGPQPEGLVCGRGGAGLGCGSQRDRTSLASTTEDVISCPMGNWST